MRKALFLDRDGVINIDHGYVYRIEDFQLTEGVALLCARALELGYKIIVATNQSGIARGYYSEEDFALLTAHMIKEFKKYKVVITDVFYCPLLESEDRKPSPGMFLKAMVKYDIDMKASVSVGDKERDIEAAARAGVGRNYLLSPQSRGSSKATKAVRNLLEVATIL
ncbi:MAG: HAD family hydrolase [Synergistaceae bacterium]|jgi:D,D-heptose 1,7-bisphosphate phosphatase|nr:HAD family hydrolase [Synergistaceae bacterium]